MNDKQTSATKTLSQRLRSLFSAPFWTEPRTLFVLWGLLSLIAAIAKMAAHRHNNYLIFKGTFYHALQQLSLYAPYPAEHGDTNHYGPVFSVVIAPFALCPDWLGLTLWLLALTLGLYWGIRKLPLAEQPQAFVYWFCAHELLTALFMQQFNIAIAAILVGCFALIERKKEFWAALLIVLGTFVKLYGIVGLALFFFVKRKPLFILSLVFWSLVAFTLPMLFTSPEYVLGQYQEWYLSLVEKNNLNIFAGQQNISLLGMTRKISGDPSYSDLCVIVPGLLLFGLPYLRFGQYKSLAFRYGILASSLLFLVLFSTGSESSTYIISFVGIALWYWATAQRRSKIDVALMIFAFILSSLSPSDLFPKYVRDTWVVPYALKALPCVLIWLKLQYELMTRDYRLTSETATSAALGNEA